MKYTYILKNSRSIWEHEGRFGYLRIHQELRAEGIFVFKNRVYKRMCQLGLKAERKRPFRPVTTNSKYKLPMAPNLLGQVFKSDGLNRFGFQTSLTYRLQGNESIYLQSKIFSIERSSVGNWVRRWKRNIS
ncbi:IS3 family transposase [Leptospira santarosai]|uniref:IS3 family transposase n=1 Tax=Leptospira santarosai TaxID=28183 RepID=UPI001E3238DA|nr:IS3 family transposase [Leptospira santarosai]